jgi:hypothetical protein
MENPPKHEEARDCIIGAWACQCAGVLEPLKLSRFLPKFFLIFMAINWTWRPARIAAK